MAFGDYKEAERRCWADEADDLDDIPYVEPERDVPEWSTEVEFDPVRRLTAPGSFVNEQFREKVVVEFITVLLGHGPTSCKWRKVPGKELRGLRKALLVNLQPKRMPECMTTDRGELYWTMATKGPRPTELSIPAAGIFVNVEPALNKLGNPAGLNVEIQDEAHNVLWTAGSCPTSKTIRACWEALKLVDAN